mgnify:CR=1 FL=1
MEIQKDFRELLAFFNAREVEYIIVGAYALAFHGVPRFTGDIAIYVRPSRENAKKILQALTDLGFGFLGLTENDFMYPEKVIQRGVPPVRIDIMTSITGISWNEAETGKVQGMYGDVPVPFLGKMQYIANKRATGREKDLADLE